MIERQERCDDDGLVEPCAICRGDVADEFRAMVEEAAARPGRVMTAEEAVEWLRTL